MLGRKYGLFTLFNCIRYGKRRDSSPPNSAGTSSTLSKDSGCVQDFDANGVVTPESSCSTLSCDTVNSKISAYGYEEQISTFTGTDDIPFIDSDSDRTATHNCGDSTSDMSAFKIQRSSNLSEEQDKRSSPHKEIFKDSQLLLDDKKDKANIKHFDSDPWNVIEKQLKELEPKIQYDSIAFQFDNIPVDEKIIQIHALCTNVTEDRLKYITIKIESLKSIYYCSNGRLLEADAIINNLTNEEADIQPCDFTAWYYVARFFLSYKSLTETKYTSCIRTHHKAQCIDNLQKARASFLAYDIDFANEANLMLWWRFLICIEMHEYESDESSFVFEAQQRILQMCDSDQICAYECMQSILAQATTYKSFPIDQSQMRKLLDVLKHGKSESTTNKQYTGKCIQKIFRFPVRF